MVFVAGRAQADAAQERAIIEERFGRYMELPAVEVETMRPATEVVGAILTALAGAVRETLPAASPSPDPVGHLTVA